MKNLKMDKEVLQNRLKKLGWTAYKLAHEVSKIRVSVFGEEEKKGAHLVTAVSNVLENPNASSFKNVEAAVRAMGGEIIIRWQTVEQVVTGHEEVKL